VIQNEYVLSEPKLEWVRPELFRIEAGSAESGTRSNEDGNTDTFNARS
jgi:hypothetical protein